MTSLDLMVEEALATLNSMTQEDYLGFCLGLGVDPRGDFLGYEEVCTPQVVEHAEPLMSIPLTYLSESEFVNSWRVVYSYEQVTGTAGNDEIYCLSDAA